MFLHDDDVQKMINSSTLTHIACRIPLSPSPQASATWNIIYGRGVTVSVRGRA